MTKVIVNPFAPDLQVGYTSEDFSSYFLKLDQTTPQTVTNGAPIFNAGINIGNDLVINLHSSGNPHRIYSTTGKDVYLHNALYSDSPYTPVNYFAAGTVSVEMQGTAADGTVMAGAIAYSSGTLNLYGVGGSVALDFLDTEGALTDVISMASGTAFITSCNANLGGEGYSWMDFWYEGSIYASSSEPVLYTVLQSVWAFKYASGLGFDDTGLYFNTGSSSFEFQVFGNAVYQFNVGGAFNITALAGYPSITLTDSDSNSVLISMVQLTTATCLDLSTQDVYQVVSIYGEDSPSQIQFKYYDTGTSTEYMATAGYDKDYIGFKVHDDVEAYQLFSTVELDGTTYPAMSGSTSGGDPVLLFKDALMIWESSPGSGAVLYFQSNDLSQSVLFGANPATGETGCYSSGTFTLGKSKDTDPEVSEVLKLTNMFLGTSTAGDTIRINFQAMSESFLFGTAWPLAYIDAVVTDPSEGAFYGELQFHVTRVGDTPALVMTLDSNQDVYFEGNVQTATAGSIIGTATNHWEQTELDLGLYGVIPMWKPTASFLLGNYGGFYEGLIVASESSDPVLFLGNTSFTDYFQLTYVIDDQTLNIIFAGNIKYHLTEGSFYPDDDGGPNLGGESNYWGAGYIGNIYTANIVNMNATNTAITFEESDVINFWIGGYQHLTMTPTEIMFNVDMQAVEFIVKNNAGTDSIYVSSTGNGEVGIGRTPATGKNLDLLGNFRMSSSIADDTAKYAYQTVQNYDIEANDVLALLVSSEAAQNKIIYGGGSAQYYAATDLYFYTAATIATTTGSSRMHVDSVGNIGIGTTANSVAHLYLYSTSIIDLYAGIYNYMSKTAGATNYNDQIYGIRNHLIVNQSGGEVSHFYGVKTDLNLTLGSVGGAGNVRNMYGLYDTCQAEGGTITGDAYGAYVFLDQGAANTISGNAYGLYIDIDIDGTVTGTAYGLYINTRTAVNYGIYYAGTSPSIIGTSISGTASDSVDWQLKSSNTNARGNISFLHNAGANYNQVDIGTAFTTDPNASAEPTYTRAGSAAVNATIASIGHRGFRILQGLTGTVDTTFTPDVLFTIEPDGDVVIGSGAAGKDYSLTFNGETNDGIITWMEDENYFYSADKWLFQDKIAFTQTDGNEYIDSLNDGYMDYGATTQHRFNVDVKIGVDTATDWALLFGGSDHIGQITWIQADDYFRFDDLVKATHYSVSLSQGSIQSMSNDGAVAVTNSYLRVVGNLGAVTLDTDPAIADGITGQVIIIEGTNDSNTVTIADNCNTQLAGGASAVLGLNDTIMLIFNGTDWIEVSRSNN